MTVRPSVIVNYNSVKARLKKGVFGLFLNAAESTISRSVDGKDFQAAGPACEKARSPSLDLSHEVTYDVNDVD